MDKTIKKEMYGLIDRKGNWVLEPTLEYISSFSNNGFAEACQDGKWGIINTEGKWVISPRFDQILYNEDFNMVRVKSNGKYGVIGLDGKWILDPLYADASVKGENGIFEVREDADGKCGYVRADGSWILPPCFNSSFEFTEGLAFVEVGKLYGLVDTVGNWIMEPQFDDVRPFEKGIARVSMNEKWGIIDKQGNWVVKPEMDQIVVSDTETTEGIPETIWVNKEGMCGMMDGRGKLIIPIAYDWLDYVFREGLLQASRKNGKKYESGYFDRDGNVAIDFRFKEADFFAGGLAPVKIGGKYGYIDNKGKLVIEPGFIDAEHFRGDLALVKTKNKWALIDRMGNLVQEFDSEVHIWFNYPDGVRTIITDGNSYQLIDQNGNVLLKDLDTYNIFSEEEEEEEDRIIWIRKNRKWGLYDMDGNEITPCIFKDSYYFKNGVARVTVNI